MNTQAKAVQSGDALYAALKVRGGLVVTGKRGRRPRAHQTYDGAEVKFCGGANHWLPLDKFAARSEEWDGLSSRCRDCTLRDTRARKARRAAAGVVSKNRIEPGQRYARIITRADGSRVKARLYQIWDSMHKRCYYPKQNRYERYGGRGIQVCAEWHEYDAFRAWSISHGYAKGLSLDRINTDGHYEPDNCRWIDPKFQQWNGSRTIHLTLDGVTKPLPQWSDELGIDREVLRVRHRKGWPDQHVLTVPIGERCPGMVYQKPGRKARVSSSDTGASR